MSEIHQKIQAIMQEIPAIGKDKKNQQQNFKYRGIDDVMNVLKPLFAKHGVYCVPEVTGMSREERVATSGKALYVTILTIKYTFFAGDGSSVSAVVVGEGMDSADKGANKAMAVGMKYALFQTLCIPTEEMIDPDSTTPEDTQPKGQTTNSNQPAQLTPEENALITERSAKITTLAKKYNLPKKTVLDIREEQVAKKLMLDKASKEYTSEEFDIMMDQLELEIRRRGHMTNEQRNEIWGTGA